MRVLITGAKGQLGTQLARILQNKESEIGHIPACYNNAEVVLCDVQELDITNKDEVLAFGEFDIIFNCAAYTNVNKCETEEDFAYKINAVGAENLALLAKKTGAKLVHISTDYVFDGEKTDIYSEDDECCPVSAYGRTKRAGEEKIISACDKYFIVRTAWLYGYYGNNFVKTIRKIATENDSIKVVADQFGNPTNVCDLAHHMLLLGVSDKYGIYHCTGKGVCSWHDFATEIVKVFEIDCDVKKCTTEEYPTPAKRPKNSALSHKNLESAVGDYMRDWKEALLCFAKNVDKES
ncbi:MAG: dTDP-4-dehydrorhamnose reductase [Clostridia bacterium]|nr:dTDP-4-dehydrorhamnose reductase [Clostridia bacterium]